MGYGLAAFTKPLFPLATSALWVVAARFVDRLGKGIRTAPRDAMIADLAAVELRGASYGLRKTLDSTGAFLGPLAAIGLMAATGDDIRLVFWLAVIPAFGAVALLVLTVKEPARVQPEERLRRLPIRPEQLRELGGAYWELVATAVGFHLAALSEAFMLLRANGLGLPVALVPLVLVAMNVLYALVAYPAGRMSDLRKTSGRGRTGLLMGGYALFIVATLGLAFAGAVWHVFVAALIWGLYLGVTKTLLSTLVADVAPARLRASAFGAFHLATGLALLPASLVAGLLWDLYGPAVPFLASAGLTTLALAGLGLWRARRAGL